MKNVNIDYIGQINLLRALQAAGVINQKELQKIAARLAAKSGADIVFC